MKSISLISGTYIQKKSRSNAQNVAKDFVSHAHWLYTRSCIWKNRHTNVPYAVAVSINDQISKHIYLRIPITNRTNVHRVGKFFAEIAISGDML